MKASLNKKILNIIAPCLSALMTLQAESPLVWFLMDMTSLNGKYGKCRNRHKEFFVD